MPARLTAYLPDRAAIVRLIDDAAACMLGRGPENHLVIEHPSVSRTHALLAREHDGWWVHDQGSKNGSFVEGERVTAAPLKGGCWLRFGDVYCEYEPLAADEARSLVQRSATRRHDSAVLQERAAAADGFDGLLASTMQAALEISGCERGFLLLGPEGALAVRASVGLEPGVVNTREFRGSVSAVSRALAERRPVVVNDTGSAPWLRGRGSIVAGGIRALAVVPLWEDGQERRRRLLGAVYVDSLAERARIAELDLELLVAFVDNMSLRIAAYSAADDLGALAGASTPPMPIGAGG